MICSGLLASTLHYNSPSPLITRSSDRRAAPGPVSLLMTHTLYGCFVSDFLITSYIYHKCGLLTPGQLTDLRSALVNNVTFAALTAKYGLNRFMLLNSPTLMQAVDAFVTFQKSSNHRVDSDVSGFDPLSIR